MSVCDTILTFYRERKKRQKTQPRGRKTRQFLISRSSGRFSTRSPRVMHAFFRFHWIPSEKVLPDLPDHCYRDYLYLAMAEQWTARSAVPVRSPDLYNSAISISSECQTIFVFAYRAFATDNNETCEQKNAV